MALTNVAAGVKVENDGQGTVTANGQEVASEGGEVTTPAPKPDPSPEPDPEPASRTRKARVRQKRGQRVRESRSRRNGFFLSCG